MKRIKLIIRSFLEIGRDPSKEIQQAWHAVSSGTGTAEQVGLIDRLIGGVLLEAEDMRKKGAEETPK